MNRIEEKYNIVIVSDYGKIIAYNVFTRAIHWSYEYDRSVPLFQNSMSKIKPLIVANNQYIASHQGQHH